MARPKLTRVLASGARVGSGKAALLESVRATGSIAAAARSMGMDHKRAWLLVDSLNRAFETPAVERVTDHVRRGAGLTPLGTELLARYRRLRAAAAEPAADDPATLERRAAPDPGPNV